MFKIRDCVIIKSEKECNKLYSCFSEEMIIFCNKKAKIIKELGRNEYLLDISKKDGMNGNFNGYIWSGDCLIKKKENNFLTE